MLAGRIWWDGLVNEKLTDNGMHENLIKMKRKHSGYNLDTFSRFSSYR